MDQFRSLSLLTTKKEIGDNPSTETGLDFAVSSPRLLAYDLYILVQKDKTKDANTD